MENALSVVRQLRIESIMITTTASFVAFYAIDAMSVYRMLRMMYTANGPAHTSPIGERTRVAYGIHFLDGKQSAKEKNGTLDAFKRGELHILVSTPVVEVGIDVPNATIMIIEAAERFGLAQLHQFRGRVGRGEHQSYCLLFTSSADKNINQRLKALVDCDDGFMLAEKDMTIRGPGEFFGVKQSGLPDLAMASLANVELIKKARLEARLLLKEDSNLTNCPLLKERLERFQRLTHFE